MAKKNVCIVGGGATGVALLWALAQDPVASAEWNVTLIHDQGNVGGHSNTIPVPHNGKTFPIDIGVQFISPMMYPNVHVMLERPEFQSRVQMTAYDSLKIAAAFPRLNGQPMNWGNFPDYQQGTNFAMYSAGVKADIQTFQDFVELSIAKKDWRNETLQEYFGKNGGSYRNSDFFQLYILAPYLSIINGYGNALMNDTNFLDMWPLFADMFLPKSWNFPTPLGSFSKPGTGWQRFAKGAQTWVQAMLDVAQSYLPSAINVILNSSVQSVWTDQTTGQVSVQWDGGTQAFDKVVLTTDMWTNSKLLNNPQNQYYWNNVYYNPNFGYPIGDYRDTNMKPSGPHVTWDLLWGKCYIHTDSSMLSPDLMQQEETLQFNAWYAPYNNPDGSNFDLEKTFTTYIQKNVLNDPGADGLYLTMYGYIPDNVPGQKMPDPTKVIKALPWTHGRWVPSAMGGPKTKLYMAQGLGNIPYSGQMNTNVYFAGNNTTIDSEDGALMSALAIANYAFGVEYPFHNASFFENMFAFTMFNIFHRDVMFPKAGEADANKASREVAALITDLESFFKRSSSTTSPARAAVMVSVPAKKKASAKKVKKAKAKKAIAKKVKKAKAKKSVVKKTKALKKPAVKKAKPARKKSTKKRSKPVRKSTPKKRKPARRKAKKTARKSTTKRKSVRKKSKRK